LYLSRFLLSIQSTATSSTVFLSLPCGRSCICDPRAYRDVGSDFFCACGRAEHGRAELGFFADSETTTPGANPGCLLRTGQDYQQAALLVQHRSSIVGVSDRRVGIGASRAESRGAAEARGRTFVDCARRGCVAWRLRFTSFELRSLLPTLEEVCTMYGPCPTTRRVVHLPLYSTKPPCPRRASPWDSKSNCTHREHARDRIRIRFRKASSASRS
jgi:hypothetical protein